MKILIQSVQKSLQFVVVGIVVWIISFMPIYPEVSEKKIRDVQDITLEELLNVPVITATKKAEKISSVPATVISISADQIQKYGWRDLKDIFRILPGIDVSYDNQGELRTQVIMRGIPGNQKIAILQDGFRYSPTTGERFVYGNNIPLRFYKRIEIVYGPASALYGPDAYAGVINLITKDGEDIDGVEFNAGYCDTNAWTGDLLFGKKIDESLDVSMGLRVYNGRDYNLHKKYDDYAVVNSYKIDNKKIYPIRDWNMFFKIKYKYLTIGGDWQHELETNAPATIPTNYAYVENNLWGQDIRHVYVQYSRQVNARLNLSGSASAGDYELNPASNFYLFQDLQLTQANPSYKYAYSGYLKGQFQADWSISKNISVISGAFYESVKSFPKTKNLNNGPFKMDGGLVDDMRSLPFSLVDQDGNVFGVVGLDNPIFGERNYHTKGIFIQSQVKISKPFVLTLGARYDHSSIYGGTFNPRVGVVYTPNDKLSLKALFGTAYIQPSNYYRWENFANAFIMHIPNEQIRPEKIRSFSLSATYYVSRNASIRAEVFRNNMHDVIRPVMVGTEFNQGHYYYNPYRTLLGLSPWVDSVEINTNQGKMITQGIELDFNYKYKNLLMNFSYTYLDGEDKEDPHGFAKVSPHKANFNIEYEWKRLTLAVMLRGYSRVLTMSSNAWYGNMGDQSYEFKGAFIAYSAITYNINDAVMLNLTVDNIFNTKHYGAAPYAESGWVQPRTPQALRKIYCGIQWKL